MCSPTTARVALGSTASSVDVDWRTFFRNILPFVDLFTPSIEEVLECGIIDEPWARTMKPQDVAGDLDLLKKVVNVVMSFGPAILLLKLGEKGLYLRTRADLVDFCGAGLGKGFDVGLSPSDRAEKYKAWSGTELYSPVFDVDCVGTLGAGDCTIAAMISCIGCDSKTAAAMGESAPWIEPSRAMQLACAVGACNVEAHDAHSGLLPLVEVSKRIARGWARRPPAISTVTIHRPDQFGSFSLNGAASKL
jgi:sugar/nucleoside kinase (ribokinase family)